MVERVPTASQYRTIAAQLVDVRESTSLLGRVILDQADLTPFDTGGDGIERTVRTAMAATVVNLERAGAELQVQIDEARRRAAVCEWYSSAVHHYHRSDDPDRVYPTRPASWAEHG